MRHDARWLRAALALAACAACNSDPYVVAESTDDNGLPFGGSSAATCKAGTYVGKFFTWPGNAGLQLTGEIRFALVRVQENGAEFTRLGPNTRLEGKDLDLKAAFSADVRTQYCVAGAYSTVLENGTFVGIDDDGNPTPNGPRIPFKGTIDGAYMEEFTTFSGRWETVVDFGDASAPGPGVSGGWAAKLVE